MNRREVIRGLLAGVATVAIGMKLAQRMPELPEQEPMVFNIDWGDEDHTVAWKVYWGYGQLVTDPISAIHINAVTA